jgi:hypothetical protein
MQQVLTNIELDKTLATEGFVVVPFLEDKDVVTLRDFFYENHAKDIPGFYATAHSTDIPFRKKMNDKIKAVFEKSITNYFHNCLALGGSYVVKSKSQEERLHPHQDWNIVDESTHRSFNIWVPLVDLNESNGAIRVVPGSHLWVDNFRGPNIPDYLGTFNENIWQHMQTLNMKAGEALIYDHRLFHASYPNKTDDLRVATVFGIIPQDAQMYYYFGDGDAVNVYESSVDFFMEGNIQKGPEVLKKVNTIQAPTLTVKELPTYISFPEVKESTPPLTTEAEVKSSNWLGWFKQLFNN